MATLEAGSDVDAYCSKCKMVLAHVIVAMKGTKPARVECKTCKSVHAYKAAAPGARKTKKTIEKITDYDQLIAGRDLASAKRYRMDESFAAEEVIDHKKFGLGLVQRVMSDGKMEVLFPDGPRILVSGR